MEKTQKKDMSPVRDMTSGNPLSLILAFAVPMLMGTLFQQFYSMVDTIIVGKFLGVDALASVGSTGAVNFMVNGFVIGVTAGFAIPVAQQFGAQNYRNMRKYVANTIWLTIGFSVVMTAVIGALTWKILVWMRTPENIIQGAYNYIFIIFLGIPATVAYNTQAGLMRAMGNSRAPLIILIGASLVNVVLDLLFVRVFGIGVLGAALATIISQIVSAIVCFTYILKNYPMLRAKNCTAIEKKPDGLISKRLVFSGLPMALQYSITAIGSVLLQTAINGFGSLIVASVTAANKVQSFVHLPFSTLGVTLSTWCGQNMGARDYDRVRRGFWDGMAVALVYSVLMGVVMYFFGEYVSLIFIDKDETRLVELLPYVREFLRKNCILYIPLGILTVCRFSLQGLEHGFTAMFAGVFEMVARSVMALWAVKFFGFDAVCYANPAAWIAACILLIPACLVVMPKVRRRLEAEKAQALSTGGNNGQ